MADLSQPNNLFSDPNDHLAHLLPPEMDEPWYKSLIQNAKDIINPPKLPPLEVTSKPVPVKDIWGLYGRKKQSFMMSTGFQIAIVVFLIAAALWVYLKRRPLSPEPAVAIAAPVGAVAGPAESAGAVTPAPEGAETDVVTEPPESGDAPKA